MGESTKIEWSEATWTPIRASNRTTGKVGWHCEHASDGCKFCYAETMNRRLGTGLDFKPGHRKDIDLLLDEDMLTRPLRWKRPRMVFVCSMTDLFADFVPDEWIDKVFAVMALAPQHTFQCLTKRSERMRQWVSWNGNPVHIWDAADKLACDLRLSEHHPSSDYLLAGSRNAPWPLPNVWLGVSAERQQEADARIPELLATPAAVRFVSLEPLLGPIDLSNLRRYNPRGEPWVDCLRGTVTRGDYLARSSAESSFNVRTTITPPELPRLDWVIVGGESGKAARYMEPGWARSIRDQCAAAGVAFFHKQMTGKKPIPPDLLVRQFPSAVSRRGLATPGGVA